MARLTSDYNLAVMNPALAGQCHPILNGDLTPRSVTPFSGKRPWWLCSKGHKWLAIVNNRRRGNGCPYCAGQLVTKDNNLRVMNPGLAKQWHPTKNGDLTPKDMTKSSNKKVWWMCRKGHEWEARIGSRHHHGCPVCWREKIRKTRRKKSASLRGSRSYE